MKTINVKPLVLNIFDTEIKIYNPEHVGTVMHSLETWTRDELDVHDKVYFAFDANGDLTIFECVPVTTIQGWTFDYGDYNPIGSGYVEFETDTEWRDLGYAALNVDELYKLCEECISQPQMVI